LGRSLEISDLEANVFFCFTIWVWQKAHSVVTPQNEVQAAEKPKKKKRFERLRAAYHRYFKSKNAP
jgi:hypothetical protein